MESAQDFSNLDRVAKAKDHNFRGKQRLKERKLADALKEFREAASLDPQPDYLGNVGFVLVELDRCQEALAAYDEALKLNPNYPNSHVGKANSLTGLKRYDEAIKEYGEATRLGPKAAYFWGIGNLLSRQGKHEEALRNYDSAIKLDPFVAAYYADKAHELVMLSRPAEALVCYREAIGRSPNEPQFYAARATVSLALKQWEYALADCVKAINLDHNSAEYYSREGIALSGLKRYDEAVAAHREAIRLDPNPGPSSLLRHKNLASALMRQGHLKEAMKELDRALELNKPWRSILEAEIREDRGLVLRLQGKFSNAVDEYTRATELDPKDPDRLGGRAKAFAQAGRFAEAFDDLDRASRLGLADPILQLTHAEILVMSGDSAGAQSELEEAVKSGRTDLRKLRNAAQSQLDYGLGLGANEVEFLKRFIQANVPQATTEAPVAAPPQAETSSRFCTNCGESVQAEDRFCGSCGFGLKRP